jgi:two-component system heavy metal sensor histidine kinase CusS
MMTRVPLTVRLTIFYLLASTVLLLGMAAFISSAITRHFTELDRETLNDKIRLIQGIANNATSPENLHDRLRDALQNHPGLYVLVDQDDSQLLYKTAGFKFPSSLLQQSLGERANGIMDWSTEHSKYQGIVTKLQVPALSNRNIRIIAAIDTAHHAHFVSGLQRSLWFYVLVGDGISGLLGWWAARAGLTPLRRMKEKVQLVTAHRLDQRLDADAIPIEFADLAKSLNEMLHRLQKDFERLSDFSSDLAHELRTPLNNLLTQNEVVLSRARGLETYRDTLASNGEELQRLSRMVSDMLLLAKAEHGLIRLPNPDHIDLEQEVHALFDFYDALAEENKVRLVLKGQAHITGDKLMLRRAISNLLSNALRHAAPFSDIVVQLEQPIKGDVRISVSNQGDPIPPDILPRLFDRFFRADKARVHLDTDGAGLGLSITQAIANAHGGRVYATSDSGSNIFFIELPASPL